MKFLKLGNKVFTIIRKALFPLSFFYWFIVKLRNLLFDLSIIKSKKYDIPVITIGNITAGGTGKTPHVEYLIEYFQNENKKVGVISRGYKRKTKGFKIVDSSSQYTETGDEPLQIKLKFPESIVCVCENRIKGIDKMLSLFPDLNIIIMDDGFQHRYVKPSLAILLIDYNRPIFKDFLLPTGNLREPIEALERSDCIIITKCPKNINKTDLEKFVYKLKFKKHKYFFYSTIEYTNPINIIKNTYFDINKISKETNILAVTGIANPMPFLDYISENFNLSQHLQFNDHHDFTEKDLLKIQREFEKINALEKYIFTTEKDMIRLKKVLKENNELAYYLYYIKIRVRILPLFNNSFEDFLKSKILF